MIAVAVAVLIVDNWFSPFYPILAAAMSFAAFVAAGEMARLLQSVPMPVSTRFCRFAALTMILSNWLPVYILAGKHPLIVPLLAFCATSMLALVLAAWNFGQPGSSVLMMAGHLLAVFYIGVLASFLIQLRWIGGIPATGAFAIALAIFTAKISDIGAYFTGRLIGRTKLAPRLSPGKTVEGTVGGVVLATFSAWLIVVGGKALFRSNGWHWELPEPPFAIVFGVIIAIAATVGDLIESLIKRESGQKDSSDNIPGFGGLLDVIDSVIFCAPIAYVLLATLRP